MMEETIMIQVYFIMFEIVNLNIRSMQINKIDNGILVANCMITKIKLLNITLKTISDIRLFSKIALIRQAKIKKIKKFRYSA